MKHLLVWLARLSVFGVLFAAPAQLHAQSSTTQITVELRDANDAGVVGALISVRAATGQAELARATTDQQGHATLTVPFTDAVRVLVQGTLVDGTRLFQAGDEVQGVRLHLDHRETLLDLRSEADGRVLPDPATMIVPQPVAPQALPTAPLAPTNGVITPPVSMEPLNNPAIVVPTQSNDARAARPVWLRLIVMTVLLLIGVMLVLVPRWRRSV